MTHNQQSLARDEAWLDQLDMLRQELDISHVAISMNSVQVLEESLWKQEVLCVGLQRLLHNLKASTLGEAALQRLQTSMKALAAVNSTYMELVTQANASNAMLSSLCATYKELNSGEQRQMSTTCSLEA